MPVVRFICNVIGDGQPEDDVNPANPFRPEIGDFLTENGINWTARDLRTWEEQQAHIGTMMVTADIPSNILTRVKQRSVRFLDVSKATKGDIDDATGGEVVTFDHADAYVERLARVRDARRRSRQRKA